jgi:peptide/nickel transport system permease protein
VNWKRLALQNRKATVGFAVLSLFILIAILAPWIAPASPTSMEFQSWLRPSIAHPLGTTAMGQDIFSQLIWGSRLSLLVGFAVGLMATFLSVVMGLTAGYAGRIVDGILSAITNIFLVIPGLPLMIIIAAYITIRGVFPIIVVIAVTGWAWGARILRSQVLTLKNRDFVLASRVAGEGSLRIIFSDILPNMLSLIMANFFGVSLYAVLSEAGLEFLGLGDVSVVTWGTMLYWAQNNMALIFGQWQWVVAPGICIAIVGTSFALINFAADEVTNPKLRRR